MLTPTAPAPAICSVAESNPLEAAPLSEPPRNLPIPTTPAGIAMRHPTATCWILDHQVALRRRPGVSSGSGNGTWQIGIDSRPAAILSAANLAWRTAHSASPRAPLTSCHKLVARPFPNSTPSQFPYQSPTMYAAPGKRDIGLSACFTTDRGICAYHTLARSTSRRENHRTVCWHLPDA